MGKGAIAAGVLTPFLIAGISVLGLWLGGIIGSTVEVMSSVTSSFSPTATVVQPTTTVIPTLSPQFISDTFLYQNLNATLPGDIQTATYSNAFTGLPELKIESATSRLMNYACNFEISNETAQGFDAKVLNCSTGNVGYNTGVSELNLTSSYFQVAVLQVDGRPALAYRRGPGYAYSLAQNAQGTAWNPFVDLPETSLAGFIQGVGGWVSVSGNPCIATIPVGSQVRIHMSSDLNFGTNSSYSLNFSSNYGGPLNTYTLSSGRFAMNFMVNSGSLAYYYATVDEPILDSEWLTYNISTTGSVNQSAGSVVPISSEERVAIMTDESGNLRFYLADRENPTLATHFMAAVLIKSAGSVNPDAVSHMQLVSIRVGTQNRLFALWTSGGNLCFSLSDTENGSSWGPSEVFLSSISYFHAVSLPSGHVGIAYESSNTFQYVVIDGNDINFDEINNVVPQRIDNRAAGRYTGLGVVNGQPAMAFQLDSFGNPLLFITNANEKLTDDVLMHYEAQEL